MKAIVYERYGAPELREIERPDVGDDEVLVRVHASSVNVSDWYAMVGRPYIGRPWVGLRKPKDKVLGADFAGQVEAVGSSVTHFRPGDEVFGVKGGALAEYVSAGADRVAAKPANLTFEQAAAVPIAALTALQALRDRGRVQPGQHVLIKITRDDLVVLHDLLEAGKVTPVIDRRYELSEAPEAFRYLGEGHARAKVVVTV
jgi:NADPH:quinone reductase-like Zn-dependent oxidoreductase